MTLSDIAKYRMINQQLTDPKIQSPVQLVEWFAAVQGQEYAQTKWGLGLRLPYLTDIDIEKELNEGKILRTHLLRPTWHFVSAADIYWLLNLTAPRVHQSNAYMYRQLELDDKVFNQCNKVLIKSLRGGVHRTRDEINGEFEKKKIIATGHRLSYIMMNAELEEIICSGARQGNQFTYALLEERVTHQKLLNHEEALAELTGRYFRSRGPATIRDFATWSGLKVSDCKKGIQMMAHLLQKDVVEGQEYFSVPPTTPSSKMLDTIYLLPVYDEFIMGYKDRSAFFIANETVAFRYDCMMVCNGQIIGTWKRTLSKNAINFQYDCFKRISRRQMEALDEAIQRLSDFMKMKVNRSGTPQKKRSA